MRKKKSNGKDDLMPVRANLNVSQSIIKQQKPRIMPMVEKSGLATVSRDTSIRTESKFSV